MIPLPGHRITFRVSWHRARMMFATGWRWFLSFARWYWRRVKEIPLVVGSFALGGFYVGVLLTSERLLAVAAQRFL